MHATDRKMLPLEGLRVSILTAFALAVLLLCAAPSAAPEAAYANDERVILTTSAAPIEHGGFTFKKLSNGNLAVTGYTGSEKAPVIPSKVDGKTVVRIEGYSFAGVKLNSLTIPKTVTKLGTTSDSIHKAGHPFIYSQLKSFKVAAKNPVFSSKDGVLFNKKMTKLICYPGGKTSAKYKVPSTVKEIGNGAFIFARAKQVVLPDSVTKLGHSAFLRSALTKAVLPKSVKTIGDETFYYCQKLSSITLLGAPKNIPCGFASMTAIKKIVLPEGVVSIGSLETTRTSDTEGAFYECTSLKSVALPTSLKSIGSFSFERCTKLRSITLPSSLKSIGCAAFGDCKNLTVTLPKSVTRIDSAAFSGVKKLKK